MNDAQSLWRLWRSVRLLARYDALLPGEYRALLRRLSLWSGRQLNRLLEVRARFAALSQQVEHDPESIIQR